MERLGYFITAKLIESDGYYKDMAKATSDKTQLIAMNSKTIYEDMRSVKIKEKTEISPTTTKSKGEVFNDCKRNRCNNRRKRDKHNSL